MVIDHKDRNPSNNRIENLKCVTQRRNTQNRKSAKENSSGKKGVFYSKNSVGNEYYTAVWYDQESKRHQKLFSCLKLGKEEAFLQACNYRDKMISELNLEGDNYV